MAEIVKKIKAVRWQQFVIILMMALVVAGTESCKSTGKMSKKERKAEIASAKRQLQSIIDGTTTLSYDEQKRMMGAIMDKNLNDPTINAMIIEAQQKLKSVLAEEEKVKAQKADVARAALYDLLLNKDNKTADELERELNKIKSQNLDDGEIQELIERPVVCLLKTSWRMPSCPSRMRPVPAISLRLRQPFRKRCNCFRRGMRRY